MKSLNQHFFSLLIIFSLLGPWAFAQDLLLENAKILNPEKETIVEGAIYIKDGKIHQVLKSSPANFDGDKIDLRGKYLLPGFMDMHTHSWGNSSPSGQMEFINTDGSAKRMLYCGVTGFLDLFSEENSILSLRDKQRREGLDGADIYCAGPILTCTGGHGTEYGVPTRIVNNPEEAAKEIAELAEKKPDVIKFVYDNAPRRMPSMDRATMEAVVKEAHKHGIKTVAHIGSWEDILHCVEAGSDAVTHTPGGEAPANVIKQMKKKGTFIIPTLVVQSEMYIMSENPEILDSKLLAGAADNGIIDAYRDMDNLNDRMKRWLSYQESLQPDMYASILEMNKKGVKIMAGTDAGNPGIFQGYSVHREMALLVKSGLTNWEALASATTTPGIFLEQPLGVEAGDLANLVVLNENPLEDIKNTESVEMVIHHGKLLDREELKSKPKGTAEPGQARDDKTLADFSAEDTGIWMDMTDKVRGGASEFSMERLENTARFTGNLAPTANNPYSWAGSTLMFSADGKSQDLSAFTGIKMKIKVEKGGVYISMPSSEVRNFDYHMYMLQTEKQDWQEVEIPFSSFQQNFSNPKTPLTGKNITGITIGASGMNAGEFAFEVDFIELY